MNKIIRSRIIASFFLIVFIPTILPVNSLYASNNGPNAPEASGFESVNATDMVNLSSGDMAYVLPLMDVGGFPISLSYHGGIPMDLESTWTGLGWNLNTGAINRGLNATPDDWKGGNSLDFIRYQDSETIYNVSVGVGICKAAEIGVGASWGSNKALSGSVFASVGIQGVASVSGSIDTNGNYSLGVGVGGEKTGGFSAGVGISGNVSGGQTTVGLNAGYRSSSGMTVGLGTTLDGGLSVSLGYSGTSGTGAATKGQAGSGGISMNSFSAGDWDINSKGWFIPIQIYFISFSFGQQKVTYSLKKAYKKQGYGILYSNIDSMNPTNDAIEDDNGVDTQFTDYQNRYRYTDAYEQSLPQTETEFVGDHDAEREKLNFTFAGYDTYDVNATGISGFMNPRILQNSTIYGLGYKGANPNSTDGKMRIYNHNTLTTDKTFGTNAANDIEFYFNGQFTQNTTIPNLTPANNTSATLQNILSTRQALNNQRLRQGNFVEVFTNKQIKNNQAVGLLSPLDPNGNGTSLAAVNRNSSEYKDDGIGGYKITAPDGKVYHFSQPVYHFEQVERNIIKDSSEEHVNEKRQYTSYATHWLLTAITGPDFIDTNNNNIADAADYGYWVRMDYGKWSDGYAWRNPTDKTLKDYNSNLEGSIGKKEFGTYQFGRKQLFYLDRVVSAAQTAYFVKGLRYDSVGSDLTYNFTPSVNLTNDGTGSGPGINPQDSFTYKRQMQLVLEKIILVKNENATVSKGNITDALKLNYPSPSDNVKSYQPGFYSTGGFYEEYGNPTIAINNESGVYDIKDFESFDYNNALKVVKLEYNYNLAVKNPTYNPASPDLSKSKGSPGTIISSQNPNAGKLCLKSVQFLGKNNFNYMPPYKFDYKGEYTGPNSNYIEYPVNAMVQKTNSGIDAFNFSGTKIKVAANTPIPIENIRAKDEWGYLKDKPNQESAVLAAAWSMSRITTPLGSSIEIENEEDDYEQEAFSRRYWENNLKFYVTDLNLNDILIEIQNEDGLVAGLGIADFRDYFRLNQRIFMDLWLARSKGGSSSTSGALDVSPDSYCTVSEVTPTSVKILAKKSAVAVGWTKAKDVISGDMMPFPLFSVPAKFLRERPDYVRGCWFSKSYSGGCSHVFYSIPRGEVPWVGGCSWGNCGDHWAMTYKILANKVPTSQSGGGIRVKSITIKDNYSKKYTTRYYYNVPGTYKQKNIGNYISSGITSYSPVRGTKFVPYQSELPSPGVMYEYVTMVSEDANGANLGETRYRFNVLKPVINIFDENLSMPGDDFTPIFKATVTRYDSDGGYLNQSKKINAKSIKLDINTSLIGQFKSIEEFNNKGQLLSKVEKKYLSGEDLKATGINRGSITESFQSMKSVFTTNSDDANPVLKNRFLSISSKEEFTSVLQSTVYTGPHGRNTETYSKSDPQTGSFLVVESTKSDGTKTRTEKVPAYLKYPEMGSKADNINNRNMLSQTAMDYSYILDKSTNTWKETGVGITTWNNIWTYKEIDNTSNSPSASNQKIWRKHKTYVWNGIKDTNGFFTNYSNVSDDGFNWNVGVGGQSAQWKQTSEITLYNHYSSPLEIKDINNNFASTKMGDNDNKIIATANAGYNEFFYSSAEYIKNIMGVNWFETGISTSNASINTSYFHTGKQSIATSSSSQFSILMKNAEHREGKYKISVWVENTNAAKAALLLNGSNVPFTESYTAGNWVLKSAYATLTTGQAQFSFTSADGSTVYYDDVMIRPVASSITGYVYNDRDELTYIIGNNGLATKFEYDNAGRLIKTYSEVINDASNGITGGFKLIRANKLNNRFL